MIFSLRMIWTLCRRELASEMRSPWIYIASTIAALIEAELIIAPFTQLKDFKFLVSENLLLTPFLGAIFVAAVFGSIIAVTCLVSEREKKTLHVLFLTPVDERSLVLAKFLSQLLSALVVVLISFILIVIYSVLMRVSMSAQLIWAILICVLLISNMVAFSLALSVLLKSTRSAILLLLLVVGLLFGLQILGRVADQLTPLLPASQFAYLPPFLKFVAEISSVISPLSYLIWGLESISILNFRSYAADIATSLLYSAALLFISIVLLGRRGVYK